MKTYIDCIMSGVGGQGVMTIGELLAYAGIGAGLNATSLPEYGTEVRGGNASCTIVLSEDPIGSPIIKHPKTIIALAQPGVDLFLDNLADGGLAFVNSSLASAGDDPRFTICRMPLNDLAAEAGLGRMVNMIALGAYCSVTGIVALEQVNEALDKVIPPRYMHLKDANLKALEIGAGYAKDNFADRGLR